MVQQGIGFSNSDLPISDTGVIHQGKSSSGDSSAGREPSFASFCPGAWDWLRLVSLVYFILNHKLGIVFQGVATLMDEQWWKADFGILGPEEGSSGSDFGTVLFLCPGVGWRGVWAAQVVRKVIPYSISGFFYPRPGSRSQPPRKERKYLVSGPH